MIYSIKSLLPYCMMQLSRIEHVHIREGALRSKARDHADSGIILQLVNLYNLVTSCLILAQHDVYVYCSPLQIG